MGMIRALAAFALALNLLSCAGAHQPIVENTVVGVRSQLITDDTRRDALDPSKPRQWMIDIYYRGRGAEPAASDVYARDPVLLQRMIDQGYYEVDASTLQSWSELPAPAFANAPLNGEVGPTILLSPGSGTVAFNYSQLASSLALRGYTVVVIDHPYLGLARLPDGRVLDASDDPVQASEDPAALTPRILEWSADVSVTLDRLGAPFDLEHVLAVGHSTGGAIALDACTQDRRIDACMNFEGALFGSRAETGGVAKPVVSVGSRARGRPQTPGLGDEMLRALSQGGSPSAWYVRVTGGSHMSFSDAPRMMPNTLTRFGGEIMSLERSDAVYAGMVDAFALAYLTGAGRDQSFADFLVGLPEAQFQSSGGRRSP